MSDELPDFFAPPPFKPDEALIKLRRDLKELKPLAEKGTGALVRFEWEKSARDRAEPLIGREARRARGPGQKAQPASRLAQAFIDEQCRRAQAAGRSQTQPQALG
jgi:hypothetical protein